MAITQEERVQISKKIIAIPIENSLADTQKAQAEVDKVKAEQRDSGNKRLADRYTTLIDGYQDEIARYDGYVRVGLVEQDFIDSVDRVLQNPFFPNDASTPTPNLTEGVWGSTTPYSQNKAIGKNYLEVYPSTITKEQDVIDNILTLISTIEGFSDIQRSTGQHCVVGGTCSDPTYTDQTSCEDNGGTWTTSESVEDYPAMQDAGDDLKSEIQDWYDHMDTTSGTVVVTDTDPTRSAQNTTSKDDITNAKSIISTWQSIDDYDTSHGQTTCSGFNGYDATSLDPTKFRATELQPIKDELTARQSYLTTRISELQGYLGSITQDLTTGEITSKSGLYGKRFGFIDLRLNVMAGSLSEVKSYEQGQEAQEQIKNANNNALSTYSDVIKVSLFRAPAAGTSIVHVLDGTDFNPGDSVYIVGDDLQEISATISTKDNNTFYLTTKVSKKYTRANNSRMYKLV